MGEGNSLKNIEHIVDEIAAAVVVGAEIEIVAVAESVVGVAEAEADIVVAAVAEADIVVVAAAEAEAEVEIVVAMVPVVGFVIVTALGVQVEPMAQRNCYKAHDPGWQNGDDDIPVYLTTTQGPDVYFGLMQVE